MIGCRDRAFAACSYMKRKSVDEEDAGGRFRQGKGLRGLAGMDSCFGAVL